MAFSPVFIECPEGCDDDLEPVSFDDCDPSVSASEINHIYVAAGGAADFTDVSDPTEWAMRLSQDGTVPGLPDNTTPTIDLIRELTCIADKPAPTITSKDISNNRTIDVQAAYVINVTVDDFNQINQKFFQTLNCGGTAKIWYSTLGGLLFGGNTGRRAQVKVYPSLGRGNTEIATLAGTVTWKTVPTDFDDFIENPIGTDA
jgi:hypothetical protein